MKLRAVKLEELDHAVALLKEGFGELHPSSWRESLLSIFKHAETFGETSIGSIAFNKDGDIGICLAIPAQHFIYETEPRKVINLAALYLKSQYQWMAPVFVRRLMSDTSADYVDVTPSRSMQEINRHLGFSTLSVGTVIVVLACAAFRRSPQTRILPYGQATSGHVCEPIKELMERHAEQGCLCLIVEHKGKHYPFIVKRKDRSGLPSSRVLLAPDRSFIKDIIGPLARYLIAKGILCLEFDGKDKQGLWETAIRPVRPCIQSTRPSDSSAIDHTFSELVFIL